VLSWSSISLVILPCCRTTVQT